jgi:hypothetical protein
LSLPPLPWSARGNRVYAADGEEIAVATKASPKHRATADATARRIAAAVSLAEASLEREDAFAAKTGGPINPVADARIASAITAERATLDLYRAVAKTS